MQVGSDIALFGGAFDPPTLGHQVVAMAVHHVTGFPVWFMPCFAHKFGKSMSLTQHREFMCVLAAHMLGRDYFASPFEIERSHTGSTYELVRLLKAEYPGTTFHIVVGADNFKDVLDKWDHGRELAKENPFVIAGRSGHRIPTKKSWPGKLTHVDVRFPTASTDVRDDITGGRYELAARALCPGVWNYVKSRKLYGYEEPPLPCQSTKSVVPSKA